MSTRPGPLLTVEAFPALEKPEGMAHRLGGCTTHAPDKCPSPMYQARVDAIRADRDAIKAALLAEAKEMESQGPLADAGAAVVAALRAFAAKLGGAS